jgi:hypothetical protein
MVKSVRETLRKNLEMMNGKLEPDRQTSNTSVGDIYEPKSLDNTFKLVEDGKPNFKISSGGSVLMNSNARVLSNSNVPRKIKERNRDTLVRTIF